eukprot:1194518-Prorocentrum_minimum.AAC.8
MVPSLELSSASEMRVAYESRKMIPAECNYPVHEKELLAILERPKKRPDAKTRKKYITNKRKVRDQPDTNPGEGIKEGKQVEIVVPKA